MRLMANYWLLLIFVGQALSNQQSNISYPQIRHLEEDSESPPAETVPTVPEPVDTVSEDSVDSSDEQEDIDQETPIDVSEIEKKEEDEPSNIDEYIPELAEEPPIIDPALLPSNLYENIELDKSYIGSLPGFSPEDAGNKPDWYYDFYPETVNNLTDQQVKQVWQYYSLDVATQLGDELRVTDQSHALNAMDKDLKFDNIDQFKDLVIEVLDQGEGFSDPNLFINLNDSAPNVAEFDLRCSFYGEDVCVISGKELLEAGASKITIGIYCRDKCEFGLRAGLETEINLTPGKMHNLYFKEKQQRIVRFSIPDSDEINTIEVRGISENKFSKFEMLILQGNKVPDTSLALVLQPAWENGYVGKFYKHCFCFCTACNYTMLISSESEGYISVGASISNETVDLKSYPNGETYDFVGYWDTKCYKYQVKDAEQDFRVNFQSFSGEPNVYVNPLVPIDSSNFTKSTFNSRESFWNEELVLDVDEREKIGALTGMYYICIYGGTSSSYKISAKNENHDKMLKTGLAEGGYVELNEVKQYYFTDSILMDENIQVKFDSHVMIGSVRVKSKLCVRPEQMSLLQSQCNFTLEELQVEDPDEKVMMHIDDEVESPDHNLCSQNAVFEDDDENRFRQDSYAPCIYVIGVIGLSDYTSQFSIMIQLEDQSGLNHPIMLSEGIPSVALLAPQDYKYYMISIDDQNITKLTIQLTTIHGDPDMFVSSTTNKPSTSDFEKRSINAGLYPDLLIFEKTDDYEIAKNYYISVESWESSSYSIVFFTENQVGSIGTQKLLVGRKQKGVFHINNSYVHKDMPILDQPFLTYHFQLTNRMLMYGKEVEIRLNAEHGEFIYLVEVDNVPKLNEDFDADNEDQWVGGELSHVTITEFDLDDNKIEQLENPSSEEELYDFYVKVFPLVRESDFSAGPINDPYVFNIAFYDEEQMIHLQEGRPQRGVVTNQTFDYFYYDITDTDSDYEISLGPVSGGVPDLVISLDPQNKYPTAKINDYISNNEFMTDQIILKKEALVDYMNRYFVNDGQLQAYIGVYTPDPLSIYSIVMTKKVEFSPIQLNIGQIMSGSLSPGMSKFYFVTASADSNKPLKIDLVPYHGNVNLYITLISDFTQARSVWQQQSENPTFISESSLGIDTIVLDSETVPLYAEKCASSCVVLIKVEACDEEDSTASYKIQVSQDFEELIDGMRVYGSIKGKSLGDSDLSRYKFYKYFKSCDEECDLEIYVYPQTGDGQLISVLVNYEDLTDASLDVAKLPTWNNDPVWSASLKLGSLITIEGNEPWFYEHHGTKANSQNEEDEDTAVSSGYYIIGVQSYSDVSYYIEAKTKIKSHFTFNATDKPLNIKQLYLGTQDKNFLINPMETQYFYFQNWRNEPLKINVDLLQEHVISSKYIDIQLGKMIDTDNDGGRVPRYKSQLPEKWLKTIPDTKTIEVKEDSEFFCVYCTYVLKIKNQHQFAEDSDGFSSEMKIRITVDQQISKFGKGNDIEKSFTGNLRQSIPQPVRLENSQVSYLTFQSTDTKNLKVEFEILLGNAKIELMRNSDNFILFEYPCPEKEGHHVEGNLIIFDLSDNIMNTPPTFQNVIKEESYSLRIESKSEIFQGVAYLKSSNSIDVISDGQPTEIDFTYQSQGHHPADQDFKKYFLYLPSSHKFELQINAFLQSFQSDRGSLLEDHVKSDNAKLDGRRVYDSRFINFKLAFKKLELDSDVKTNDVRWAEEFQNDEQFDLVLQTKDRTSVNSIYDVVQFSVDPEDDLILVKVEGIFDSNYAQKVNYAELQFSLQMSSSDVTFLSPGKAVRGIVSDSPGKLRVYEFYVNEMQFPEITDKEAYESQGMDLFLSLTPCSGKLKFYISDNYKNLFKKQSELGDGDEQDHGEINISGDQQVLVHHKTSRAGGGTNGGNLEMDEYFDEFRVKGKRLKRIDRIIGTKLYIGIKSLESDSAGNNRLLKEQQENEEQNGEPKSLKDFKQSKNPFNFKPPSDVASESKDNISSFEISATYVLGGQPDILDLYKVKDYNFGIQLTNLGQHGPKAETQVEWSPVMRLDKSKQGKDIYTEVTSGVEYKLYLGYNNESMNIFASACQLEEFDTFQGIKHGNRQLRIFGKNHYRKDHHGKNFTVFNAQDQASLVLTGGRHLINLKSAVVIAYIYEEGQPTTTLMYAPVSFDQTFDRANFRVLKKFKLWMGLCAILGLFAALTCAIYKYVEHKNVRDAKEAMKNKGYQMRTMSQNTSVAETDMTARSEGVPSDISSSFSGTTRRNNAIKMVSQDNDSDEDS